MHLPRSYAVIALGLVLIMGLGCATSRQTRSVETSGFLVDYGSLSEGSGDEAQLVYVDESANFAQYDAIMIDSVTLWYSDEADRLDADTEQQLTDYFYQSLHEKLSESFRVVDAPGPGVLRLRAALTEADGASVVANTVTSIFPPARLAATLAGAATDVQVFVGRASAEAEITDSLSGRRLIAAVDQRSGTKALRGGIGKWSDVKTISDYWAERSVARLVDAGVQTTGK
jgi:hypothetical protein